MISPSQRPLTDNTQHSQQTNIHATGRIRTHDLSRPAAADLRLRPRGYWDRHTYILLTRKMNVCFMISAEQDNYAIFVYFKSSVNPYTKTADNAMISNFDMSKFYSLVLYIRTYSKVNDVKFPSLAPRCRCPCLQMNLVAT